MASIVDLYGMQPQIEYQTVFAVTDNARVQSRCLKRSARRRNPGLGSLKHHMATNDGAIDMQLAQPFGRNRSRIRR